MPTLRPARRVLWGLAALGLATVAALVLIWLGVLTSNPGQVSLGRRLYAEHCAPCHGAKLEGQPNWQQPLPSGRLPAPPHDASGHTWHHPDAELFTITKKGLAAVVPGYESDMPAFEGRLSDEEIRAILAFIRSTWPRREREYHEAQTRARP